MRQLVTVKAHTFMTCEVTSVRSDTLEQKRMRLHIGATKPFQVYLRHATISVISLNSLSVACPVAAAAETAADGRTAWAAAAQMGTGFRVCLVLAKLWPTLAKLWSSKQTGTRAEDGIRV